MDELIRRAAALLKQSRHAIALTGAGISTPSGIPDFRSPGSGLWTKADPSEVASIQAFRRNPRVYYQWRRPLMRTLQKAKPNAAHHALAELEQRNLLRAVITQNIDGLHQRAGSRRVLEVHGTAHELVCLGCGQIYRDDESITRVVEQGEVPYCGLCGGVLKPNVVFFGELLPHDVIFEVEREIRQCDLVIVAGSSLEVQPACWWPQEAMAHGAEAVIINYVETYLDERAAVAIHEDVAKALPALVAALD